MGEGRYFCIMTDVHDKKPRSYNNLSRCLGMSQIKAKNTKPELLVRKFLHANGFRFRLHGHHPSPLCGEGNGGEVTRQA